MINFYIQKDNNVNAVLIDNDKKNNKLGCLVRVNNKTNQCFYFINDGGLSRDILFFGRNKAKSRLKDLFKSFGFKVIVQDIGVNGDLIKIPLEDFSDYKGLFNRGGK